MIYFKYLKNLNLKKFKNALNELKLLTNKNKFYLTIDIILCSVLYGAGYHDYWYYEFYNLKHKDRKTILTRIKNNKIIKKYNDPKYAYIFEDKYIFMSTFKNYIGRNFMKINDNNKDEFINFFKKEDKIVLKPLNKSGGEGIELKVYKNSSDALKVYNDALLNEQFLVEGYINQHSDLNKLYKNTINTLRVFTFYNNGSPKVVYSILKIGRKKLKDNFSLGGMYALLDENGKVITDAIDIDDNVFSKHPISKYKIKDFEVPLFKEVKKLVKEAALVIKDVQYIGWDVAISCDKPVLIEGNYYPGIFQMKPSLTSEFGLAKHLENEMNIKL